MTIAGLGNTFDILSKRLLNENIQSKVYIGSDYVEFSIDVNVSDKLSTLVIACTEDKFKVLRYVVCGEVERVSGVQYIVQYVSCLSLFKELVYVIGKFLKVNFIVDSNKQVLELLLCEKFEFWQDVLEYMLSGANVDYKLNGPIAGFLGYTMYVLGGFVGCCAHNSDNKNVVRVEDEDTEESVVFNMIVDVLVAEGLDVDLLCISWKGDDAYEDVEEAEGEGFEEAEGEGFEEPVSNVSDDEVSAEVADEESE